MQTRILHERLARKAAELLEPLVPSRLGVSFGPEKHIDQVDGVFLAIRQLYHYDTRANGVMRVRGC